MLGTILTTILIIGQAVPNPGFLSVRSDPPGFPIFVESDSIGTTPISRYQLDPGKYWVTVVSNDSLEALYRQLRTAGIGKKLSALWTLARIDGATSQVEILPGMETTVAIDYQVMQKNATRAKWLFAGTVGGIFGVGLALGLVIGLVAN